MRQSRQHLFFIPSTLMCGLVATLLAILSSGCQHLPARPHLPESQKLTARINALYPADQATSDPSAAPSPSISDQGNGSVLSHQSSEALDDKKPYDLAAAISEQNEIHPELSGYHPIVTGADAFAARSILTEMAQKSIDVQYYIWHNDEAGQLLLKELWEAAERGVIVRLLLDDFNNSAQLDQHLLRFASHPNIAVRLVNPLMHRQFQSLNFVTGLPRINRRMHNKSMTFDNQITIIGGRNIGNEYLSNNQTSQFADLDVILIGRVVDDVRSSFEDYWSSNMAFDIETLVTLDGQQNFLQALDHIQADLSDTNADNSRSDSDAEVTLSSGLSVYKAAIKDSTIDTDLINKQVPFRWTTMRFLSDDIAKLSQTAAPNTHLVHQLRSLLGTPTDQLTIISSYFVPTHEGVATLVKLANEGVKIRILTNSFHATDVTAVHSGYSQWRPILLKAGIKLYELKSTASEDKRDNKLWRARSQSSTSLHAKTFAVDDHQVFIGSYNVDPRSANINTEMGVIINDDDLAQQLHNTLSDTLLDQAYEVLLTDQGQLQWRTIENGEIVVYDKEPQLEWSDQIWLTIMSWLPIDWLL